jgi:hypothetical protein
MIAISALRRRFLRDLDNSGWSPRTRSVVTFLGVTGGTSRGAVFAGAGLFLLGAAIRFDPHQAKGLDSALRSFAQTPAGPWLLVAVALGLVLFGGYSLACARWQRF